MTARRASFGRAISETRKKVGLSQKELAASVLKENGSPISAQYLNDIEHDRRNAPPDTILVQLARLLDFPEEYLYFLARRLPPDWLDQQYAPDQVKDAFEAFRMTLNENRRVR